jgi:hypothetical protein
MSRLQFFREDTRLGELTVPHNELATYNTTIGIWLEALLLIILLLLTEGNSLLRRSSSLVVVIGAVFLLKLDVGLLVSIRSTTGHGLAAGILVCDGLIVLCRFGS